MPYYPTAASVSCLCGKISAQQIVVASPPPRSPGVSLCHCSICRSASGVLCTSYYRLLSNNASSMILNPSLTEYTQSTQLRRWFCGTCGAHVLALAHLRHENKYFVSAGLVTPTPSPSESESVGVHWGVGDTGDGGISVFIPGSRNDSAPCLLLGSTTNPANPSSFHPSLPSSDACEPTVIKGEQHLRAQCHCGGVSFLISRPHSRSREASSPWPDLLVPYHSAWSKNPEDVKWWLRSGDTKYLAGTCACRSCRLACGFPIQCWAFIPKVNLINNDQVERDVVQDGGDFSYNTGTMQSFESSPGIYREFCRRCGATVFWHCDERPGVVDVSVGLLRSAAGARAEDWLDWETGRVSFAEDAEDKSLIALLGRGLQNPVYH